MCCAVIQMHIDNLAGFYPEIMHDNSFLERDMPSLWSPVSSIPEFIFLAGLVFFEAQCLELTRRSLLN